MELEIRQATVGDLAGIAGLQTEWAHEGRAWGTTPEHTTSRAGAVGPYALVATIDEEIVGFAHGEERLSEDGEDAMSGGRYLQILDLFTSPTYRGTGIGSALLDALMIRARSAGVERYTVYSPKRSLRFPRFFGLRGFRPWYGSYGAMFR